MLRRPEDFEREGSKVFRKAPINNASVEGWIAIARGKVADAQRLENSTNQGIEPSKQDVEYALQLLNRVVPRLLEHLKT